MRSTLTTTVLVILAETTVPSRRLIRSRIFCLLVRRARSALLRTRSASLLSEQSHNSRKLAARAPIARVIVELIGAQLEPEPEHFLARFTLLHTQVGLGHLPEFVKLQ